MKKNIFKKIVAPLSAAILFVPVLALAATDLVPCDECGYQDFLNIINKVMTWLIVIAGPISAIVFAYAGWLLMTSGDNPSNRSKAKGIFWKVLAGYAIMLIAWLVVRQVLVSLGIKEGYSILEGLFGPK